jgi:hypothetical protein
MEIVTIKVSPTPAQSQHTVNIGKRGEDRARAVCFDVADLIAEFGDGEATVRHRRPDDETQTVETTRDGNIVRWTITATDTAQSGTGRAELVWTTEGGRAKSATYKTLIIASPAALDES